MYLFVGLGSPGKKYIATRHNVGYDMISYLSEKYDIPLNSRECRAYAGKGYIGGRRVMLAQPLMHINDCGYCVRALAKFYRLRKGELILIYDDVSLPIGRIRIRPQGGAGGHNGVKSIIRSLGTTEFPRIKIGVGAKPEQGDLSGHVMRFLGKEEEARIRDSFVLAEKGLLFMLEQDVETAMREINGIKIGE